MLPVHDFDGRNVDLAGTDLERPITTETFKACRIVRGRDVRARYIGKRTHQSDAIVTLGNVASVKQNIAICGQ